MRLSTRRFRPDARTAFAACLLLGATVAACSGDGFERIATFYTGIVFVPAPSQCRDCDSREVFVQQLLLRQNQPPLTAWCGLTNKRGIYNTSGMSTCTPDDGLPPPGDGTATVIVVATVNKQEGGQIGGLISSRLGQVTSTNFNGTTHIACKAGVFLTRGTEGEKADPGCKVKASCSPGEPDCFTTLPPNDLDDTRISNLEAAAQVLEPEVNFTKEDGVNRASCAVINCTKAGEVAATTACLDSFRGDGS